MLQGVPPGARRQDDLALQDAHVARVYDLVGGALFQHAVLMDAARMGEGVRADDGLVRLHQNAGRRADHAARLVEFLRDDARLAVELIAAHLHRHDNLFQRGVARALPDAVDGAFDLPRAVPHARQRVRDRHAQIVVTVDADDGSVYVRHMLHDIADQRAVLFGRRVASRVRDIDDGRARLDDLLDDPAEIVPVCAARILQEVLHIVHKLAGVLDRLDTALHRLLAGQLQLVLQVAVGDAEARVDARAHGVFQRLARHFDVLLDGARQAADRAVFDDTADGLHRLEIAGGGDGKARLDHVHAEPLKLPGDLDLLLDVEGGSGRLFAVAQGGVENVDSGCHDSCSSLPDLPCGLWPDSPIG